MTWSFQIFFAVSIWPISCIRAKPETQKTVNTYKVVLLYPKIIKNIGNQKSKAVKSNGKKVSGKK